MTQLSNALQLDSYVTSSVVSLSILCLWQVLVQPSSRRAYSMHEYEKAGAIVTDDITEADTILGQSVCEY